MTDISADVSRLGCGMQIARCRIARRCSSARIHGGPGTTTLRGARDRERHGIVNGGHTYAAIRDAIVGVLGGTVAVWVATLVIPAEGTTVGGLIYIAVFIFGTWGTHQLIRAGLEALQRRLDRE